MPWGTILRSIPLQTAARDSRCRPSGWGTAGQHCEGARESWVENRPNKFGNYNRFNCLTSTPCAPRFIGLSRISGHIKVISMIPLDTLKKITADGLAFIKTQKDISDAEIFISSLSHLLSRVNYTSSIPCNGVEEPKSTLSYGVGVQAVFKEGNKKRIGFGSQIGDISIDGIKSAVEKAKLSAVEDPDFYGLPVPSGAPILETGYYDQRLMDISDRNSR